MIKNILLFTAIILSLNISAQSITNGNFSSGTSGWGCSPEVNRESVYGGPTSNRVAEIDNSANLCQTITGLTIGSVYEISFDCSRRTNCGPATQTLQVSVDGGALAGQNVSRTGSFNYTSETITFTATQTNHFIRLRGISGGTCGLIVDNIAITLAIGLPVELLNFNATAINIESVKLDWQTATEVNNDYFTIERSLNAIHWEHVKHINGVGNSDVINSYNTFDNEPFSGVSYYRLKQTDFDGKYKYSAIRSVNLNESNFSKISIYPNPASDKIIISGKQLDKTSISIFNNLAQDVTPRITKTDLKENSVELNLSELSNGLYFVNTNTGAYKFYKH